MRQGEARGKIQIGSHLDLPSRLNSKEINVKYNIMMHEHQGDESVLKQHCY